MEQGKQELLNAILEDAQNRVKAIEAETAQAVLANTEKASGEVQAYMDECAARDKRDAADIVERRKVAAGMEGKKALLAQKRALMDAVKARLVERLYALSHEECLKLVDTLLKVYAATGDQVIIPTGAAVTFGDVQSLDVCRRLTLKVDYGQDVKSGLLLKGKAVDRDLSFEALADSVFADNEMALAERLFGK
jgi:vacuolar-type H+-ATPase subunit E/Vma4